MTDACGGDTVRGKNVCLPRHVFVLLMAFTALLFAPSTGKAEKGIHVQPPSASGFSADSIVASGLRGGDLVPVGSGFTAHFNREMGEAMEAWNAHHWEDGVARFKRILEQHPDSPWAAEAELHVGCFCYYNGIYDEAEERFLAVWAKYPKSGAIRRKVLRYLPHLYAMTGRFRAAQDVLNMMADFPLNWDERQFYENMARFYHRSVLSADRDQLCGAMSLALAREVLDNGGPREGLRNVALEDVYRKYPWSLKSAQSPDGYSLQELAEIGNGTARQVSWEVLKEHAHPGSPIVAYLAPASEPRIYARLGRRLPPGYRKPSGHFILVESADDALVQVLDPKGGRFRMAASDFRYRWEGAVLALTLQQAHLGKPLPGSVAGELRGGCCGQPPPDPRGGGCQTANTGGGRNGPGLHVSGPGDRGPAGCSDCSGRGAFGSPGYVFGLPSANLVVMDTPMWYPPAKGPGMSLDLVYNRVNSQNMASNSSANYYCFGNKWSFNFGSFVQEAPNGDAKVVVGGGEMKVFAQTNGVYVPRDVRVREELLTTSGVIRLVYDGSDTELHFSTNVVATNGQQLVTIRDKYGNDLVCQHDDAGRLTNVVDAIGRFFSFSYSEAGYVTNVSDALGRSCAFSYSAGGNLTAITDMGGYATLIEYDDNNWITNITYPSGDALKFDLADGSQLGSPYDLYAAQGYPAFQILAVDALGYTNAYLYHAFDDPGPVRVCDAGGNAWLYAIDVDYPSSDPERSPCIYYDAVNERYLGTFSRGAEQWEHRKYDASGDPIEVGIATGAYSTANGNAYTLNHLAKYYTYDTNHWVVGERWKLSGATYATWSNVYDGAGNLVWRRDPLGGETRYAYNAYNDLVAITDALGSVTLMDYDSNGNVTNLTDPRGNFTRWVYDGNGWQTAAIMADDTTNEITYDSVGRLLTNRNPAGLAVGYEYDDLDRVTRITFPDSTDIEYEFSCCGLDRTTDRLGHSVIYDRDALGRVTEMINDLGHSVLLDYDGLGNVTTIAVPVGRQTNSTTFQYTSTNGFTRLTSRVSASGKGTSYSHTFRGWLASRTDGKGGVTDYSYDALGRLKRISYGSGTNVDFTYDPLSRATQVSDWYSTNTFAYDVGGRVTNKVSTFAIPGFSNVSFRLTYQCDAVGNVTGRTLAGLAGFTNIISTSYSYDEMNRLTLVSNEDTWAAYAYDTAGRLSTKTYGNGDVTTYGYDIESRLTSLVTTNGTNWVQGWYYAHNAVGMVTEITNATGTWSYQYDGIYQLTGEVYNVTNVTTWSYDEAGNRVREVANGVTNHCLCNADNELVWISGTNWLNVAGVVEPGPSTSKWYDSWACTSGHYARVSTNDGTFAISPVPLNLGSNQLVVTVTDVSGNTATEVVEFVKQSSGGQQFFSYDNNGNLITQWIYTNGVIETNSYTYDMENRLTAATRSGAIALECWYDGYGRRLAKREVVAGVTNTVLYVYDGWEVMAVLAGDGRMLEYYTYGLGVADGVGDTVSVRHHPGSSTNGTVYIHDNHRGDVTVSRLGMTTLATYEYEPFGNRRSSWGCYQNRFLFSSKEYDRSVGLYYYGFRFYVPALGRWQSEDPIRESGGINIQGGFGNNPLNSVDPLGRQYEPPVYNPPFPPRMKKPPSPPLDPLPPPGWPPSKPGQSGPCICSPGRSWIERDHTVVRETITCTAQHPCFPGRVFRSHGTKTTTKHKSLECHMLWWEDNPWAFAPCPLKGQPCNGGVDCDEIYSWTRVTTRCPYGFNPQ